MGEINIGIVGPSRTAKSTISQAIAEEIQKNIIKNHKHSFCPANDGTNDLVCTICGLRSMQAVAHFK